MSDGYSSMSDPEFLAERKRVREAIEDLQEAYELLNQEFDRRARAAWSRTATATP